MCSRQIRQRGLYTENENRQIGVRDLCSDLYFGDHLQFLSAATFRHQHRRNIAGRHDAIPHRSFQTAPCSAHRNCMRQRHKRNSCWCRRRIYGKRQLRRSKLRKNGRFEIRRASHRLPAPPPDRPICKFHFR